MHTSYGFGGNNVYTFENIMHTYFKDVFDPFDVLSQAKYLDTKHMYNLNKNKKYFVSCTDFCTRHKV